MDVVPYCFKKIIEYWYLVMSSREADADTVKVALLDVEIESVKDHAIYEIYLYFFMSVQKNKREK